MIENDDNKKEDNKKPDNKSSKKKLILKKKSVQFTNVNASTDKETNDDVCAAQYSFAFNTPISLEVSWMISYRVYCRLLSYRRHILSSAPDIWA